MGEGWNGDGSLKDTKSDNPRSLQVRHVLDAYTGVRLPVDVDYRPQLRNRVRMVVHPQVQERIRIHPLPMHLNRRRTADPGCRPPVACAASRHCKSRSSSGSPLSSVASKVSPSACTTSGPTIVFAPQA